MPILSEVGSEKIRKRTEVKNVTYRKSYGNPKSTRKYYVIRTQNMRSWLTSEAVKSERRNRRRKAGQPPSQHALVRPQLADRPMAVAKLTKLPTGAEQCRS